MANNKKTRKKYNKNKSNYNKEVNRHWIAHIFTPLFQFFYQLKDGKAYVITDEDNKEYVSINMFGKQYLAHDVLEKWSVFIYLILKNRNIKLEFAPLLSFKDLLLERGTENYILMRLKFKKH